MKKRNGFTLVELAIVLMVVGLLIGGVLRGQELMENARIATTIQQAKSYHGALATFQNTYAGLPGDLSQAVTRLPGCNTGNSCKNGNGDGKIGTPTIVWNAISGDISGETAQAWKHLALTHIISGVDPSADALVYGKSHPASSLGGGFGFIQAWSAGSTDPMAYDGLSLRLQSIVNAQAESSPTVSPHEAAQIDRKMDDGTPRTGGVRSSSSLSVDTAGNCEGVNYVETDNKKVCALYFVM